MSTLVLLGGAAAGLFVIVLVVALVVVTPRQKTSDNEVADLSIELEALEAANVPAGAQLEFYGTPVRLMVLVIAPAGRVEPPQREELPKMAENLLPGLMSILKSHQPIFRMWPPQLSSRGFGHVFYNNLRLPGNRGKGTPWCGVVGKFQYDGQPFLAGFICRAENPNGLSEVSLEHEGHWLDVLRIRQG